MTRLLIEAICATTFLVCGLLLYIGLNGVGVQP